MEREKMLESKRKYFKKYYQEHKEYYHQKSREQVKRAGGSVYKAKVEKLEKEVKNRDILIEKCCEYEEKCLYDLSREEMDKILFADLRYTLTKLKEEHDLYIVSNCQKGYIELFLEKSETGHLFKDFLCFGDTGAPKGITIKQLMLNNYLQPKHTLYIGDTRGDYEATLLAGIKFIYAGYGFGNLENMEYEIKSLSELL